MPNLVNTMAANNLAMWPSVIGKHSVDLCLEHIPQTGRVNKKILKSPADLYLTMSIISSALVKDGSISNDKALEIPVLHWDIDLS